MDSYSNTVQFIPYIAFTFTIIIIGIHFVNLLKLGAPKDKAKASGSVAKAVLYANTIAMSPAQKESAYKHLPTYTAGMLFHIGAFLTLLTFLIIPIIECQSAENIFKNIPQFVWIIWSLALLLTGIVGFGLLIHRLFSKRLKPISHFDDYFSNGIVTLFQLITACKVLLLAVNTPHEIDSIINVVYAIVATVLFLYFPFGKLRHALYYFAARYHLGFFYGSRNVWPPKK